MRPSILRSQHPLPWLFGMLAGASVLAGVLAFGADADDPADGNVDAVSHWTDIAFDAGATLDRGTTQAREMAMTHIAIHDALNGIRPRFASYTHGPRAPADASAGAAIAAAARTALDWAKLKPFLLGDPAQVLPPPPPALASARYARDYAETASLGGEDSTARTAQQTATARFWAGNVVGSWNEIARNAVRDRNADPDPRRHLDAWQAACLYALLNAAMSDGFVAGWHAKYRYHAWRPVTAIPRGDSDGNPATAPDPHWMALLPTPEHPEYPSTHSVLSAAAAGVLDCTLGDDRAAVTVSGDGRLWRTTGITRPSRRRPARSPNRASMPTRTSATRTKRGWRRGGGSRRSRAAGRCSSRAGRFARVRVAAAFGRPDVGSPPQVPPDPAVNPRDVPPRVLREATMIEIPLQPDLGIEHVADLQAALMPHLDTAEPVVLDGGPVARVHTAGLQLLHAFIRDRAARGCETTLATPSPTLAQAARDLALAVSLGVDVPHGEHS